MSADLIKTQGETQRDTESKQQERRGNRNERKWNKCWFGLQEAGEM